MSVLSSFTSAGKIAAFLGKKAIPGVGQLSTAMEAIEMAEQIYTSLAAAINGNIKPGANMAAFLSGEAAGCVQVLTKLQDIKRAIPMFLGVESSLVNQEVKKKAQMDVLALSIGLVDTVLGPEARVVLEDCIESNVAVQIKGAAEKMLVTYPKIISLIYCNIHNSYRMSPYRDIIGVHDLAGYTVSVQNGKTQQGSILSYFTDPGRIIDKIQSDAGASKCHVMCFPLSLRSNGDVDVLFDKDKLAKESSDKSLYKTVKDKLVANIQSLANEFAPNSDLVEEIDLKHSEVYTHLMMGINPISDPIRFDNIISKPFSTTL